MTMADEFPGSYRQEILKVSHYAYGSQSRTLNTVSPTWAPNMLNPLLEEAANFHSTDKWQLDDTDHVHHRRHSTIQRGDHGVD